MDQTVYSALTSTDHVAAGDSPVRRERAAQIKSTPPIAVGSPDVTAAAGCRGALLRWTGESPVATWSVQLQEDCWRKAISALVVSRKRSGMLRWRDFLSVLARRVFSLRSPGRLPDKWRQVLIER